MRHGDGADEPLVQYDGADLAARRFLEADHQGSVILIADAAGAVLATNRYDEYGVPASTNAGRFGYTGQQFMGELSMTGQPHAFYYYKARIYRADIGRFLQVDPVGYDDQINLYAYVANDPVNETDPQGTTVFPNFGGALWEAIPTETRADILEAAGDALFVVSVVADIANTAVSPTPDVAVAGAAGRVSLRQAAQQIRREAQAAANRARNLAKGIPSSRLGPSGKPKGHTVQHSTRKSQHQAAKKEADKAGGKVRHDTKPADGKRPHMQAEDAAGKNVKPVVHHCGPNKNC